MAINFCYTETMNSHQLNDDLVKDGAPEVASEMVADALQEKMQDLALAQKESATKQAATARGLGYRDLRTFPIPHEALELVSEASAATYEVIPFFRDEKILMIGVTETDQAGRAEFLETLKTKTNRELAVHLISPASLARALALYQTLPHVKILSRGVRIGQDDIDKFSGAIKDLHDLADKIGRVSTTERVGLIIAGALQAKASDIHIEAEEKGVVIRYRMDGVLHDVAELAREQWGELASRLKLLAKLKLNITDRPQDGNFPITLATDKVDVRVSALPTAYGESFVLRLLRSSSAGLKFTDLGIRGRAYEQLEAQIKRPNGMILTTGPTGSGKTTTLYAMLNLLNSPSTKIITLEDPIEYKLAGINQSQVDPIKGYTFASGLKAALRQDPDVLMVGEIRDLETAETAINAALTGHLVLSTLHTNSAAASIPRLLALGAKPFLMAPAVNAVIGQRLVRRLCEQCKQPATLEAATLARARAALAEVSGEAGRAVDLDHLTFFTAPGCEACQQLGYSGRIGVYEVLLNTPEIQKMILAETAIEQELITQAKQQGMISMVQDGLLKALDGITSVEEVFRVTE